MDTSKSETNDATETTLADDLSAAFEESIKEPSAKEPSAEASPEDASAEGNTTETVDEASDDAESSSDGTTEIAPPDGWSDEDKQTFMTLDEGSRQWALKLAGTNEGAAEELQKFRSAFDPYKHLLPQGSSEIELIQRLLSAQQMLETNPQEGIAWLQKAYGIEDPKPNETLSEIDEYVDPEIQALKKELTELKTESANRQKAAEAERQKAMVDQLTRFRDETDDDGKTLHPHFNDVWGVMAGLLQANPSETLETSYEKAVWSIPEYRDSVVNQQAEAAAAKQLEDKIKASEKAKEASTTVQGQSSAKEPPKPKSMKEDLSDNYDKSIRGEL